MCKIIAALVLSVMMTDAGLGDTNAPSYTYNPPVVMCEPSPIDGIIEKNDGYREQIARVVMSEANGEPLVGKVAIVATIFNRARMFDMSIYDVIHSPNQYSVANNGVPTDDCYEAIDIYCKCPELFPDDMLYFRLNHYHKFSQAEDYAPIGSHYFSTRKGVEE